MRSPSLLLLTLALAACSSEIDNKPVAEVAPVVEAPPQPEAPPEVTGTPYTVDAAASKIGFVGAKVTKDHKGGFGKFEGTALVNNGAIVGTDFTIDLKSVSSDAEKLTEHLLSPDFFDVEKFATSTFTSRDIQPAPAPTTPPTDPNALVPTHTVTGELDLHGVKKSISFPAVLAVAADKATVKAEFVLNRKDFGIEYPGKPDDLIKDEVLIQLDLAFPLVAATPTDAPADGSQPVDPKVKELVPPGGPQTIDHKGPPPGGPVGPGPGLKGPGPAARPGEPQGKAVEGGSRK